MDNEHSHEGEPDLQAALDALDDPDCRTILEYLAIMNPMTAHELSTECDIPLSTLYRKLDLLKEASLVIEKTEIQPESQGRHRSHYHSNFEVVSVTLDEENGLALEIKRPARDSQDRLAELWSEMRE